MTFRVAVPSLQKWLTGLTGAKPVQDVAVVSPLQLFVFTSSILKAQSLIAYVLKRFTMLRLWLLVLFGYKSMFYRVIVIITGLREFMRSDAYGGHRSATSFFHSFPCDCSISSFGLLELHIIPVTSVPKIPIYWARSPAVLAPWLPWQPAQSPRGWYAGFLALRCLMWFHELQKEGQVNICNTSI